MGIAGSARFAQPRRNSSHQALFPFCAGYSALGTDRRPDAERNRFRRLPLGRESITDRGSLLYWRVEMYSAARAMPWLRLI